MATVIEASSPEAHSITSASSSRPLTPIQEHEVVDEAVDEVADHASIRSVSSQPSSVASVVNYHIDSDAVVLVKKGNSKTLYQISSCSIALASPVWCAILYGKDSQKRPAKGEWSIALEADPKALDTIFRIVHYEFNKVPTDPDLDDLFEIACLIFEYKCTHLTYPWADRWVARLADLPSLVEESSLYAQCHKAIWIAWVFGAVKLFEKMTNVLIGTCNADADGRLTNTTGTLLSDMILPPGLLELISEIRMTGITTMLEAVNRYIKHLSSGDRDSKASYCKVGKNVRECEAMMLGSVIPKLVVAGLYPVPKGSDVTLSILDLKATLDHIETIPYVGRDWMPHQSHEPCCFIVRDLVSACVENMPSPLKHDYLDHLTRQADISGIQCNSTYQVLRKEYTEDSDLTLSVSTLQGSVESDASGEVVESKDYTTA